MSNSTINKIRPIIHGMLLTSRWYWCSVNGICSLGCPSERREAHCWPSLTAIKSPLEPEAFKEVTVGEELSACGGCGSQCAKEAGLPRYLTLHCSLYSSSSVNWVRETSVVLIHLLPQMSANYLKLIAKRVEDTSLKALFCIQDSPWQPKDFCPRIKYIMSNDHAG